MRLIFFMIVLISLGACVIDDDISKRVHGQQLVCHKGRTQAVSAADAFVHQDHGDTLGPCPGD